MCVYICVYMCVYVCVYMCVYMCVYICVCICVCIYVCVYMCVYISCLKLQAHTGVINGKLGLGNLPQLLVKIIPYYFGFSSLILLSLTLKFH